MASLAKPTKDKRGGKQKFLRPIKNAASKTPHLNHRLGQPCQGHSFRIGVTKLTPN
jgi:hypothetical protein